MPVPQSYETAKAFRQSLEERLKRMSLNLNMNVERLRRHVTFERMLARLFAGANPPWVLRGGYALELRMRSDARGTKDIDLSLPVWRDGLGKIRERLQETLAFDLKDWFVFELAETERVLQGAPLGGSRFHVTALVDSRVFARFLMDVGVGDPLLSEPEWLTGHEFLDFAGIPPARVAVVSLDQQFAEKMHAYTRPWTGRTNTRVRDLVDMVLLIRLGLPDRSRMIRALRATFDRRDGHPLPADRPVPPEIWKERYAQMAEECGLDVRTTAAAYEIVSSYWKELNVHEKANG